jgi:uncharacterized protein (TIGR02594 family)
MMIWMRIAVLAFGCVAGAVAATDAGAKPKKRHPVAHQAYQVTEPGVVQDNLYPRLEPRPETRVSSRRARGGRRAPALERDDASMAPGSGNLVAEARRHIGGNPTGRSSLWCGAFMDMVLRNAGHRGGGNLARGYVNYGRRVSGPVVGAIAVMARRGGGHVGVVSGVDSSGNPIIISGNHNRKVAESVYPRSRIIAYVVP